MFVDSVEVTFHAGNGGDGRVSFRRERYVDRGGPDGGDGGHGGNVILQASNNQNTLAAFRYQKLVQAQNGQAGDKSKRHGKSGADLVVKVPVGTVATDAAGNVLADLTTDGQTEIVAKGGQGGYGNAHFTSSTRQAPRVAEKGELGETIKAVLELKMIADVGIVGLPNAGKSTFLSVVSNARPEIADYPFTTLTPNLGVVDVDSTHSLLLADIPGLIEGAHTGKGLGDEFLRHVERTSVLLHLIDIYSPNLAADYKTIMSELAAYKVDLSQRPQVVVLTKIEGLGQREVDEALKSLKQIVPRGVSTAAISSPSGEGVKALLHTLVKQVAKDRTAKTSRLRKPRLPVIGLKLRDDHWQISTKGKIFIVSGSKIERFGRRTDFANPEGLDRLRDIMRKMGIMRELERRGIESGQTIQIGDPAIGRLQY